MLRGLQSIGASGQKGPRGSWVLIGVLLVAAFLTVLNETVMGVALPEIMREYSISAAVGQWLTTAYMLVMASVIPMTGFLLQRFSSRQMFVFALASFAVGTALAATSPTFGLLLLGRVCQAVGTALVMPMLTTTILTAVRPERRGRAMSLVAIVTAVAPALGPTVSGALIAVAGWRAIFWVVLPLALALLVVGSILVPRGLPNPSLRLDLRSAGLAVLAFGGLVYGLGSLGEIHTVLSAAVPVGVVLVGALALVVFIRRQGSLATRGQAFLDLRIFASRTFATGAAMLTMTMAALFGSFIILPLYMQNVMSHSALTTGLVMLPGGLLMGMFAPVVGALFDRFGVRPLALPGSIAVTAGLVMLALLRPDSSILYLLIASVAVDLGVALVLTPVMSSSLGSLAPELYTHGSAAIGTLQQLAGAAGTAIFVAIARLVTHTSLTRGVAPLSATATGFHFAFVTAATVAAITIILAVRLRSSKTTSSQL